MMTGSAKRRSRRRGLNLRAKFSLLILLIVVGAVSLVAIPLSLFSLENQQRTLTEGLLDNVRVLVDSIAGTAFGLLLDPQQNVLDLAAIPGQRAALAAARFVTVTGIGAGVTFNPDAPLSSLSYVWASDDPAILAGSGAEADFGQDFSAEGAEFVPGLFQLRDNATPDLATWQQELDTEARSRLGDIPQRIAELSRSIQELTIAEFLASEAGNLSRAEELAARLRQEQQEQGDLSVALNRILRQVTGEVRSIPAFGLGQNQSLQDSYLFYAPIVARSPAEDPGTARYYRGAVRLAVSTEGIQQQISSAQQTIITRILLAAGIALGAGIAAGILIATLVAVPITRLVDAVEQLRKAADLGLAEASVTVRSRDELRTLADAVNLMAQDLRKGEEQAKEVRAGKEIQQQFIPLRPKDREAAQTIAERTEQGIEFFGYFEGARGVSGDYFDFFPINTRDWVFIKCDVSGKGIAAGIIATMVATLYKNEVKIWQRRYSGRELPPGVQRGLVERMNDLIEARGFTGRFAAFNMGHLNIGSGTIRFCNAGDNLVNIFRSQQGEVETVELARVPAAGVMSSDMLPGFPEEEVPTAPGDIIMLFTDGFDESRYFFRDTEWNLITLDTADLPPEVVPSQQQKAQAIESGRLDSEEFSPERQAELLRCATLGKPYRLVRAAEAFGDELVIDFSRAPKTLETVCMGMVSVEQLWRLHRGDRTPAQVDRDRPVQVDRNVDRFLSCYFTKYESFFGHPLPDSDPQYRSFTHLFEDDQTDDLTALMIRRPRVS